MSAMTLLQIAEQQQDPMQKGIFQQIASDGKLMKLLNFIPCEKTQYEYLKQATLGEICFRGINGTYDPSAGIVNPATEQLAPFGGIVQLDHVFQGSLGHTRAVLNKSRAAALYFDWAFVNADPAVDAKAFYGLKSRIGEAQKVTQSANGATITWEKVIQALNLTVGENASKAILLNRTNRMNLINDAMADNAGKVYYQRVSAAEERFDGALMVTFDDADLPSPIMPFTETCGTSQVTSSIYVIQLGGEAEQEYVQGLIFGDAAKMIVHKPLAQTNTQVSDLVEMFAGVGIFHGRAAARIVGVKAA